MLILKLRHQRIKAKNYEMKAEILKINDPVKVKAKEERLKEIKPNHEIRSFQFGPVKGSRGISGDDYDIIT